MIDVKGVHKTFTVPKKGQTGIRSLFVRKNEYAHVLKDINFHIDKGEFVGYLGPNGAGKSTTIKLLTGILYPTKGSVQVNGFSPYDQRYQYTYTMGVVFGHRSLLEFDIPVRDSLTMYKAIYELDDDMFTKRLARFTKLLHLDELLHIPVRKLSLGQRMRCEIAASLIHNPSVIFLDEPTIGLDAVAKEEIRTFLRQINKEEQVTIILTTHDMDDIEALCKRVIFIDHGRIIYDGPLTQLRNKYATKKEVEIVYEQKVDIPPKYRPFVHKQEGNTVWFHIDRDHITHAVGDLLRLGKTKDVSVHEPRLEEVVKLIYTQNV